MNNRSPFDAQKKSGSEPWPDPLPLQAELPAVPEFDVEYLPDPFRNFISDIAESTQTPPDFAGAAAIVSLAGCIGHRAQVQPKALNDGWQEICNLWGANIGPVGVMKSPLLRLVTWPLERIQKEWNETAKSEVQEYENLKRIIKMEQECWESGYKAALKAVKPLPPRPDDTLWEPGQRRLLVTDCTFEMLHQIQSANPAGVFMVRDELVGLLAGWDREGHEGERQYWLQNWNGSGGFTVDRIGRGTIFVPYTTASLFGNIVPARLKYYLNNVLTGGPTDDGLFARFQVAVWPDIPKSWKYVDRPGNHEAADAVEQIFRTLVKLSGKYPLQLRFSPEAQEAFVEWLTNLELRIRGGALSPILAGHLSKYRKLMPALAGIFELADCASRGELETKTVVEVSYTARARRCIKFEDQETPSSVGGATPISLDNAAKSIALCKYLEAHAARIYSCVVSPEIQAANELGRHIQNGETDTIFASRSIYRKCWSQLETSEKVEAALGVLEDANWIRSGMLAPSEAGGRPSQVWLLSPKIVRKAKIKTAEGESR